MSPLKFEICVNSIAGVRAAREAGAERVELCGNLLEGGTTPSLGTILVARKVADIKIHVMIRPRGGDFLYDEDEVATDGSRHRLGEIGGRRRRRLRRARPATDASTAT